MHHRFRPFAHLPLLALSALIMAGSSSSLYAQASIQIIAQSDEDMTDEQRAQMQESMLNGLNNGGISFAPGAVSLGGINPQDGSQLFQLLSNESVRKELQLSEEQYEGAQTIQKASRERMSKLIRESLTSNGAGGMVRLQGGAFSELIQKNQEEAESALEEILLPKQLERIRQLAYQVDVAQEGIGESLANGRLGEEIGVYDQQRENLIEKAASIDEELHAAVVRIHAAARAKLFKELTPEQRKKAEELLGDYFHYQEESLQKHIRRSMKQIRERNEERED